MSALPGGEVSLPPLEGTAEGVVVWERVASDLGELDEPVRIQVRAGRATKIEGGASAARLRDVVATVRDADNIGEIGIGESFMDGDWWTPDLVALVRVMLANADVLGATPAPLRWLGNLIEHARHRRRDNTVAGSRRNIHRHYDLGNAFFRLTRVPAIANILETDTLGRLYIRPNLQGGGSQNQNPLSTLYQTKRIDVTNRFIGGLTVLLTLAWMMRWLLR